jgi:LemA protein
MSRLYWILAFVALCAVLIAAARLLGAKTELEVQREQIEVAWTKVAHDLDRRAEVLPRLLALVNDEGQRPDLRRPSATLGRSLEIAREAPDRVKRIEANRKVEIALHDFQAAVLADPQLARNPDIQRLLEEILAVENRIHQDRTEYNEAVQRFNTRLALFPSNVAATAFGIRRHDFYVTTDLVPSSDTRIGKARN